MTITITPSRYLLIVLFAFLTACQEQSVMQPIATSSSTSVVATVTMTLEPLPDISAPTPMPTRPGSVLLTPDGAQVERWMEYQTALAKAILSYLPQEEVLCEWEILGRSGNDVYMWAVCRGKDSGGSMPAVIQLESDGSVLSVETATSTTSNNSSWSENIVKLFPPDVREKFAYYNGGRVKEMEEHIEWRRIHPEEPPLIILAGTPTP